MEIYLIILIVVVVVVSYFLFIANIAKRQHNKNSKRYNNAIKKEADKAAVKNTMNGMLNTIDKEANKAVVKNTMNGMLNTIDKKANKAVVKNIMNGMLNTIDKREQTSINTAIEQEKIRNATRLATIKNQEQEENRKARIARNRGVSVSSLAPKRSIFGKK